MLIPLAMGLIGQEGNELPTPLEDEAAGWIGTRVLPLADLRHSFRFVDVPHRRCCHCCAAFRRQSK
jgi:aminopeptidase N